MARACSTLWRWPERLRVTDSTPVPTHWRFGRLIFAFGFVSVCDTLSAPWHLDSDLGRNDDYCSRQDNTAHNQRDT
jgi:hypothetical protein